MNRRQTGNRELARIGPRVAGVNVLLGVKSGLYFDEVGRNSQHVRHNLSRSRLMSLALRHRPQAHYDLAVNIQLRVSGLGLPGKWCKIIDDLRLAKIIRSRVERGTDTNPDPAPFLARGTLLLLPIVPPDQFLRERKHARVIARIIDTAVRCRVWHFVFANVVAQPHLVIRNAERVPANVEDALHKPELLHARIPAIRPNRALIRHHLVHVDANVLDAIRSRQHLRPDNTAERLISWISAAIIHMTRVDRCDHSVFVQSYARVEKRALVSVSASLHVFGPRFRPFDRTPARLA